MFARYPFVRQNDTSDCGSSSLAMISLYHGSKFALEDLRRLTGTDRVGTNLLGLARAAEKLGYTAKGVHGEYEQIGEVQLPAVAHVERPEVGGHFVVLYEANERYVVVGDPAATGVGRVPAGRRSKSSGRAICCC